jgi:hypothetical protein
MDFASRCPRGARRALTALGVALLGVPGCSLSTGPSQRPTSAHIIIDGTAAAPLQLVISTDFYETQDATTAEIVQVFNTADTVSVDPPDDRTVDLGDFGGIAVHLKNLSPTDASVRMRVSLDNGQGYDYTGTLPQGQEFVYVYLFGEATF